MNDSDEEILEDLIEDEIILLIDKILREIEFVLGIKFSELGSHAIIIPAFNPDAYPYPEGYLWRRVKLLLDEEIMQIIFKINQMLKK